VQILVVDDDPQIRETLGLLLEDEGREVTSCGSAEAALQHLDETAFDVILTDVRLPRMSGIELAARVHATHPETWIVLSSGGSIERPPGDRRLRVLAKPFTLDALDALLAEMLGSGPPPG
jgi:DNA-binding NtrC family response regulator